MSRTILLTEFEREKESVREGVMGAVIAMGKSGPVLRYRATKVLRWKVAKKSRSDLSSRRKIQHKIGLTILCRRRCRWGRWLRMAVR